MKVVEVVGADAHVFFVAKVGNEEVKLVARTDTRHAPRRESGSRSNRAAEAHVFDAATGERLEEQ